MEGLAAPPRVVVLDTETTGLDGTARIVEFAALEVDPRTGRTGRALHALVNPQVPIPAAVTRIHGIADRHVAGKKPFAAIATEVAAFVRGATLAIQNAAFDCRILNAELARANQPSLEALGAHAVDTIDVSRALFPLLGSHRLDGMCDHLGVDRSTRRYHGALVDVKLLAAALPRLAAAYDALHAGEAPAASSIESAIRHLCGSLEFVASTRNPERADRAFARVATVEVWLRKRLAELYDWIADRVPLDGWCSATASARWETRQITSWKAAAVALLRERDLLRFRQESRATFLTPLRDEDEHLAAQLKVLERGLDAQVETAPLACLTQTYIALDAAHAGLVRLRGGLREDLVRFAGAGYRLAHARLDERASQRTDYRAALAALAPRADLAPFTRSHPRLKLCGRDLSACEALFGCSSKGGALKVAV